MCHDIPCIACCKERRRGRLLKGRTGNEASCGESWMMGAFNGNGSSFCGSGFVSRLYEANVCAKRLYFSYHLLATSAPLLKRPPQLKALLRY